MDHKDVMKTNMEMTLCRSGIIYIILALHVVNNQKKIIWRSTVALQIVRNVNGHGVELCIHGYAEAHEYCSLHGKVRNSYIKLYYIINN